MRILQVARQFYPAVGGIESVTRGLSSALRELGHHCDVVTLRRVFNGQQQLPADELIDGGYVYRLPYLGSKRYTFAPQVLQYPHAYDLVHIHAIDFFIDCLGLGRRQHGRPLVVNTHGGIFHTRFLAPLKQLYFRTITRLSLRNAAAVICDSEHDAALFRPIVPASKLFVLRNGVDLHRPLAVQKAVEPGLILCVGRVAENKGADRAIELLPQVAAACPQARLVWVGHDQEGKVAALRDRAAALGVAGRVEFAGQVDDATLADLWRRANVYLAPARYEAFGVATIEAMASGTVPVVTPVGIHPEAVADGASGFLIPVDEPPLAAERLIAALSLAPAELTRMGEAARTSARRYGWDTCAERYVSLYERVVAGTLRAARD